MPRTHFLASGLQKETPSLIRSFLPGSLSRSLYKPTGSSSTLAICHPTNLPSFLPTYIVKSPIPIPIPIPSDPVRAIDSDPIRISIHSSSIVLLTRRRRRMMMMEREGKEELWVFAYGSLVWNPGFDFDERIIGFIRDYRRVFDLACFDHRGTPEKPARTCTLEAKEGELCWGAAYCVRGNAERQKEAMQYLQRRECEYDNIAHVDFYKEGETLKPAVTGVQVFVSTPDPVGNKYYLGPAPLKEMALQIATANGPCGNNRDYVFLLEKALSDIGHEDDYVTELAKEVRKCLQIPKGDISPSHVSRQLPSLHLRSLPETPVAVDS